MKRLMRRAALASAVILVLLTVGPGPAAAGHNNDDEVDLGPLARIQHLVVIYQENRSFDNLYGLFPDANGLDEADGEATTQVDLGGNPFACLPMSDRTLTSPPLPADACSTANGDPFDSHFANEPFGLEPFVPPTKRLDLVHRFYQEQVQINGGRMNKFTAVSNAKGLTMGFYDTARLPVAALATEFTLADHFFHAAFGGSFLNAAWLICACTPVFHDAEKDPISNALHTVLNPATGLPVAGRDGELTVAPENFVINNLQPFHPPFRAGTPVQGRVPPQTFTTIGDELTGAGVSWAWYAGGWNGALAGVQQFQFHHQPFVYFEKYAPETAGRAHLRDEEEFFVAARQGILPAVSFVKPAREFNEHPGTGELLRGQQHVVELVNAVRDGPNWHDTAIVITYDENGGQWDHVAPPTDPEHSDRWGPGTRVPTIVIAPFARRHFIDDTLYDTTSILATIEHRWNLPPLGTRDAHANDLREAFKD